MSEEKTQSTLAEKLNATGSKIADLTSRVASSTKSAMLKTNDAVKSAVSKSKAKIETRREEKAKKAKEEFSAQGLLADVPPMVTLPEFENERLAIVSEQNENQVLMLEHMQRLSERVDVLERRNKARLEELDSAIQEQEDSETVEDLDKVPIIGASAAMVEALHILGVSIVWIAVLIGIDKYGEGKEIVLASTYPLAFFSWSLGAFTWSLYLMHRLLKSGIRIPLLIRLQTSLAVGLITLMGVMLNEDSMGTVSSVWTWGTLVTIVLLIGSSMIATAWRSTKKLVTPAD
tara:strand:+ start:6518 stop:7384 length:867 start_codon:yes stop_codon:yes gene_type:complete